MSLKKLLSRLRRRQPQRPEIAPEASLLELLRVVAMAANEASDIEHAARSCLPEICRSMGWPVGHLYLTEALEQRRLEPTAVWYLEDPTRFAKFRHATETLSLSSGAGLPGRVHATGEPEWIVLSDSVTEAEFPRLRAAREVGIATAFGVPVAVRDEVVAVLEFFSTRVAPRDPVLVGVMEQIALQLARVLERGRAEVAVRDSELEFRSLAESAHDPIISLDESGEILFWNAAAERTFGYSACEVVGKPLEALLPARHQELHDRMFRSTGGEQAPRNLGPLHELHGLRKDGTEFPLEVSLSRRHVAGRTLYTAVLRDTSERAQNEAALRESEERYALAARGANDGLWDWDLQRGTLYLSGRWKEMLGCPESESGSDPEEWFRRVHPEDLPGLLEAIDAHVQGLASFLQSEHRMLHTDGGYRWMLCRGVAVRDAEGKAFRMAGSLTDITDRKLTEEQLLHDALHDPLTGLANRAVFMNHLENALGRAQRQGEALFAVLFLDVDRFKVVNDSLGHLAGDRLLVAIARRLERCVRGGDTVARLGGDEFALLLEGIHGVEGAVCAAERILSKLGSAFVLEEQEVYTSASIGITMGLPEYARPEDVLRDADTALYRAKTLGRARHHVFHAGLRARAVAQLTLETNLRRALERQELRVHYQPIVRLKSGRIAGFEALVRWQRPGGALIPPAEFIPVAEETGLILPIDWWVLEEACRNLREWQTRFQANPPLAVTVNLSARQFADGDLVDRVERVLRETGIAERSLRLEITESALLENADAAKAMLSRLKLAGLRLYLDDFGMGYSALRYLQQFPIDALKIDRHFVGRMDETPESMEIVRTIVSLARNLGLEVIAEGVETASQRARLEALDCDYAQGFLFSHPVRPASVPNLIVGASSRPAGWPQAIGSGAPTPWGELGVHAIVDDRPEPVDGEDPQPLENLAAVRDSAPAAATPSKGQRP